MIRTQIQLPDEVYARARRVADAREMSFAELARRGIEQILNAFPAEGAVTGTWQVPVIKRSRLRVPLASLRDMAMDEESGRSMRGRPT